MSHRADSLSDLKDKSSELENNKLKAKERIFGWPVSDAVAKILKRVKVARKSQDEGNASSGGGREKHHPSDDQ